MHAETNTKVQQLVKELQHLFDTRLISVCVYGSSVSQEKLPAVKAKHQDINVLVILQDLALSDLEKASSIGKWWEKIAHALPMFLSLEEWERSKDVFALEYADIRDQHTVVFGKDIYSHIDVDCHALRLVCELELHRKLIFLRQRLLVHRDQPQVLLLLLQEAITSIAALFRGVLRLDNPEAKPPQNPQEVFDAMKTRVPGYDPAPLQIVLASKHPQAKTRLTDVFSLFGQVVEQVHQVTQYVDQCYGFTHPQKGVQV